MKGVFDVTAFILLVLGALVFLLGLNNYKSHKEKFDVRYLRYATGICLMLSGLVRTFIGTNKFSIIIPVMVIFSISSITTYIKNKKHIS